MGIWSEYITTSHPNALVDLSKVPRPTLDRLYDHGLFHTYLDGEGPESIFALHKIMEEMYDTALILYYFTPELCNHWRIFLKCIENQNPDIDSLVIYLFCSDEGIPYKLEAEENSLVVSIGLPFHVAYFDIIRNDEDSTDPKIEFVFNNEKFKENLQHLKDDVWKRAHRYDKYDC